MEVTYHLTEEDYLHFNLFPLQNSKTVMKSVKIRRFATPIMFIVLSISKVFEATNSNLKDMLIFACLLLVGETYDSLRKSKFAIA